MNPEIDNETPQLNDSNPLPNNQQQQLVVSQVGNSAPTPIANAMIPYKNKNALIGYYLGFLSLLSLLVEVFLFQPTFLVFWS
ncbi:hypothetical protein KBC31_01435 [Candidatus Saccharibacteria bacterium]|nr:hypothetical protein [Candidatus Saccharibacteria bacterium]